MRKLGAPPLPTGPDFFRVAIRREFAVVAPGIARSAVGFCHEGRGETFAAFARIGLKTGRLGDSKATVTRRLSTRGGQ
jgi:hypothetical protein